MVAMRPQEAVALAHVLYLLGPLPADPLAPAEVLAGGFGPLQSRQRSLPPRSRSISAKPMAKCSIARPMRCPGRWTHGG